MSLNPYYQYLKEIARKVRSDFSLISPRVMKSDLRRIYRAKGIRIDLWPYKLKNLRGAYFNDNLGPSVMLYKGLPNEPLIFTMAHELKHHLVDQGLQGSYFCDSSNSVEEIEIGAEIFAAELIFPDEDFVQTLEAMGVIKGKCTAPEIVHLKHNSNTTLSYAALCKKAEFYGFAIKGSFKGVRWKQLQDQIIGIPFYRRVGRRGSKKQAGPTLP